MKYSAHKCGGFGLGEFSSIAKAKKAIRDSNETGFFQIVDLCSGLAIWEGWR